MAQTYVLASTVEWCSARYELQTSCPKAGTYEFVCPDCKAWHEFDVREPDP